MPLDNALALGTWHLALGTWHLALGTWHLALGTWHLALTSLPLKFTLGVPAQPPPHDAVRGLTPPRASKTS